MAEAVGNGGGGGGGCLGWVVINPGADALALAFSDISLPIAPPGRFLPGLWSSCGDLVSVVTQGGEHDELEELLVHLSPDVSPRTYSLTVYRLDLTPPCRIAYERSTSFRSASPPLAVTSIFTVDCCDGSRLFPPPPDAVPARVNGRARALLSPIYQTCAIQAVRRASPWSSLHPCRNR